MAIIRAQIESLKTVARRQSRSRAEELKRRIIEAESWGVPSNESSGLSHVELVSLLRQARLYIERLEKELREH